MHSNITFKCIDKVFLLKFNENMLHNYGSSILFDEKR